MAGLYLKSTPTVSGAELPYEDGIPLESSWHLDAMYLLIRILRHFWRDRADVYVGGNMFIYFDPDQVKNRNFRGPDFFVIKGVKDNSPRNSWVVWEEAGLTPDLVVELASPSTVNFDITGKKEIYRQMLATPEYIVYDPDQEELHGWRLVGDAYVSIEPNERGWLWCEQVGLWLGVTDHQFVAHTRFVKVLRFFDEDGDVVSTREEDAEVEIARLKALLAEQGD